MDKEIIADRCKLRPFRESDLSKFCAYRSLPEVAQFQSWDSYSFEDALALYCDLQNKDFGLQDEWYQLAIASLDTDALIGDVAIHFMAAARMEIGFTISPEFQCKGYGREGVRALLAYLFADAGADEVIAVTDAKNAASIKLLEGLGFSRDPKATRQVIFKGEPGEEFDYALTKSHWRDLQVHSLATTGS